MPTTSHVLHTSADCLQVGAPAPACLALALPIFAGNTVTAAPSDLPPTQLSPLVVQALRAELPSPLADTLPLEADSPRLTDLFQQVPGIISQESFGGFDPPRLAVRGSGLQSAPSGRSLRISLFGMPMNAADGSFNLSLLESAWMDSVELTRGTAAGVPALGGSLDFGNDPFSQGGGLAGSFGSDQSVALRAGGAFQEGGRNHTGLAAFTSSDGWRPHSRQDRASVFGGSRIPLGGDSALTIQFLASRPWHEVPGPLTESAALHTPEAPQPAVVRDQPRRETGYAQLAARVSRELTDTRVSLSVGASATDDEFYQLQANGVSDTRANDVWLQVRADRAWGGSTQHTGISAMLQSGWWDALRYRNDRGDKGALIGRQRLTPLTITTAIDHRADLGERHHLDIGISALSARRDIKDRFDGIPGSVPMDLDFGGTRLAPRMAWSWDVVENTTLTASWSRSHEPPAYTDLISTAGPASARVLRVNKLDWQRADTIELGARGHGEYFNWTASLYHSAWNNELLRLANADGSTRGTVNADDTVHSGFEGSFSYEFHRSSDLRLIANAVYNYNIARFDGDSIYGDGRLGGVPPHTGLFGLRAEFSDGWYLAPRCEIRAGTTYADHANDLDYGSAVLWSLEMGRRHPDGWKVSLAIENLFDATCIASTSGLLDQATNPGTTAIFLPANGRTITLGLEYNW